LSKSFKTLSIWEVEAALDEIKGLFMGESETSAYDIAPAEKEVIDIRNTKNTNTKPQILMINTPVLLLQ
jgi:hypothetical protein